MKLDRITTWIEPRPGKRGTTYNVRWIDEAGRQRGKSAGRDKKRAKTLEHQIHDMLTQGEDMPRAKPWAEFVKEENKSAETLVAAKSQNKIKNALAHLTRLCSPKRITDVDAKMLERFVILRLEERDGRREETVSPHSVKSDLDYIRRSLNRAKKKGYLRDVPDMPVVKRPKPKATPFTVEEVFALLDACGDDCRMQAFIWLSLMTSQRLEDVLSIRWANVDLDSRTVVLSIRKTRSSGVDTVAAWLDDYAVSLLQRLKVKSTTEWVFETEEGTRWSNNVLRAFNRVRAKAGIVARKYEKTIHSLRDTAGTGYATSGASAFVTAQALAHRDPSTAGKYYVNILPDDRRRAAMRLPYVEAMAKRPANTPQAVG